MRKITLIFVSLLYLIGINISFAGNSLVLTPGSTGTSVDPWRANNQSWQVEFQLHNIAVPAAGYSNNVIKFDGTGFTSILRQDGYLAIGTLRDTVVILDYLYFDISTRTNVLIRVRRDVDNLLFTAEMWNYDGTGYEIKQTGITSINDYPVWHGGGILGGVDTTCNIGFARISDILVPLNSKPPTTANAGNYTELKFDNSLIDSTGNGHDATFVGASYVPTPNQIPIAIVKTYNNPAWTNIVSFRAGYENRLDGTSSYSLTDASDVVSYKWVQVDTNKRLQFNDVTIGQPTILGAIFGQYDIRLEVTDIAGNISNVTSNIGAVATDDNGVVINSNPNVDKIFGSMIAYGRNPWGFADERALTATTLRKAAYENVNADGYSFANPSWKVNGEGTVTYIFAGVGGGTGVTGTTLAVGISDTDTSIEVVDASKLDLTGLPGIPVRILVGGGWGNGTAEEIEICNVIGNVLTVCYDGRGKSKGIGSLQGPRTYIAGTGVGQYRVNGTGSKFITDINVPLCPNGIGPMGMTYYETGTVTLTAGSNAIVGGGGANWVAAVVGKVLRVEATHSGGTPFLFDSVISARTDATNLTLSRNFPLTADTNSYSYKILSIRYPVVHYQRASVVDTTSDGMTYQAGTSCMSETVFYAQPLHDYGGSQPTLNSSTQANKNWSYLDSLGAQSAFGPNFYGEGMAHRALYYRSGLTNALIAANEMDENWLKHPEIDGGYAGGMDLLLGGGVISGISDLVVNPATSLAWTDVYGFVLRAPGYFDPTCVFSDSRGTGYVLSWLTLAALFDTNPVNRATWKTQVQTSYAIANGCKGNNPSNPVETNSWASGGLRWNNTGPKMDLVNGSAIVTAHAGSDFSSLNGGSNGCHGVAMVNVTMTNGNDAFTGVGLINGGKIVINGTKDGARYTGFYAFSQVGGVSGNLSALWPGDSGTFTALITDATYAYDWNMAIANDELANSMMENFECIYNNPGQITLNRPWEWGDSNDGSYSAARYIIMGKSQQPYMLGIYSQYLKWASLLDIPEAPLFEGLSSNAATWLKDYGFDPYTGGLNYGRVSMACEPNPPPAGNFYWRHPSCSYGNDFGWGTSRPLNGEIGASLGMLYGINPTIANKTWGDTVYGSLWGYPPWTIGGVYTDGKWVYAETSNSSLANHKWTGFFFGMGMAHQWPAARLGGVSPLISGTTYVGFDNIVSAASTNVVVTNPSGKIDTYVGCSLPCPIMVDMRQGKPWVKVRYLDGGGGLITEGEVLISLQ